MDKDKATPQPVVFSPKDFEYFAPNCCRDREYNKFRLQIRRKLGRLGEQLLPTFKKAGLDLVIRTSLHHPYTFNGFAVGSQWVYFAPAAATYKELQEKVLGVDLGEELDLHYTHTLLLVGIEHGGLFVSLKIHQNAWWDGQNVKNKYGQPAEQMVLLNSLRNLSNFCLKLHTWPNRHVCDKLTPEELKRYFDYYIPGDHWFHLDCEIPKENPLVTSADFTAFARKQLVDLIPVYQYIVWNPGNNFLFKKTV